MSGRKTRKPTNIFDGEIFIKEEETFLENNEDGIDSKETKHNLLEIEQILVDEQQVFSYEKPPSRRLIAPPQEPERILKPKDEDFDILFLMSMQPFLMDTPPNKKLAVRIRLIQALNMENLEFENYKNDDIDADSLDPDSLFLLSLKPMLACVPAYRKLNVNAKMLEIIKKESTRPG